MLAAETNKYYYVWACNLQSQYLGFVWCTDQLLMCKRGRPSLTSVREGDGEQRGRGTRREIEAGRKQKKSDLKWRESEKERENNKKNIAICYSEVIVVNTHV